MERISLKINPPQEKAKEEKKTIVRNAFGVAAPPKLDVQGQEEEEEAAEEERKETEKRKKSGPTKHVEGLKPENVGMKRFSDSSTVKKRTSSRAGRGQRQSEEEEEPASTGRKQKKLK